MNKFSLFLVSCLIALGIHAQERNLNPFFHYFINTEYDSASVFLERKLQESPNAPLLHYYLGKTYLALKQPSKAIDELEDGLENKPTDARVHHYIGLAYEEQGMDIEAMEAYRSALRWKPHHPAIQLKLAALHYKNQDYEESISVLKRFLSGDSTHMQAYYLLGRSYIKRAEFDSAVAVSSRALVQDSTYFPNLLNLGIAYFNLELYEETLGVLENAVQLSPRSAEARFYLGQTYYQLKEKGNAANQLKFCGAMNSKYKIRALKTLVMVYYNMRQYQDCIDAAKEFNNLKTNEYLSFVNYYKARALSDSERYEEAEIAFEKTLKMSNLPFINSTYFFRGLNHYYQKDYAKAISTYKQALALDPNYPYALYNLAIVYDDYYEDKMPAIRTYEKFLRLYQDNLPNQHMIEAAMQRLTKLKEMTFFSENN